MKKIGLILPAFMIFLPAFAETFLFIGDSITDGNWGTPNKYPCGSEERNSTDLNHVLGHGYVEMTAGFLLGEYPDSGFRFMNRGISGETLQQIAARWQKDLLEYEPEVISLLCGTNDVHYWLEKAPASIDDFDFPGYEQTLDSLISLTKDRLPECRIELCTPFVAKVGWVGESSNYPLRKEAVDSLAAITRRVVEKYKGANVGLVDFNNLLHDLLQENSDSSYWVWDGIHPTTAMHFRMSKLWIDTFRGK